MAQEPNILIWNGSGSFSTDYTSYHYFDNDPDFVASGEKLVVLVARRLGYPIVDVELTNDNLWTAFEQSILDYSNIVNSYTARDTLLGVTGQPSGSLDLSTDYIQSSLVGFFKLADQYATEVGAGGTLTWYTGSINIVKNKQVYDLVSGSVELEVGDISTDAITVRKIFHYDNPVIGTYFSSYTDYGNAQAQFTQNTFGMQYTMMPLDLDVLRLNAIEMSNQLRKSAYSFQITGNRIRLFPVPNASGKVYFHYTLDKEAIGQTASGSVIPIEYSTTTGIITDFSNIPYGIRKYSNINEIGKNWIRRYTIALAKEVLGLIRSKYSEIPMTYDNSVTLNGQDLLSQAQSELESLRTELVDLLDSMSKQSQLERKQAETDALKGLLIGSPLGIYIK